MRKSGKILTDQHGKHDTKKSFGKVLTSSLKNNILFIAGLKKSAQ